LYLLYAGLICEALPDALACAACLPEVLGVAAKLQAARCLQKHALQSTHFGYRLQCSDTYMQANCKWLSAERTVTMASATRTLAGVPPAN